MSDRQNEKFKRRIRNRIEEVEQRIRNFGSKNLWSPLDRCEYDTLVREYSGLKRALARI